MPVDEDFIRELTRVVWTAVLGLEADAGVPVLGAQEITTSVDITGAWVGTVSLSFSRELGQRLTAAMLACPESEATPDLVQDVVGELANVIGGNVKGVLPGPCKLSQPRVETEGSADAEPDSLPRVWFDCGGLPFSVAVRSREVESAVESDMGNGP